MGHLEKRIIIGALGLVAVLLTVVIFKGLSHSEAEVLYIPLEPVALDVPISEQAWPSKVQQKTGDVTKNVEAFNAAATLIEKPLAVDNLVVDIPVVKEIVEPVAESVKTIYEIKSGDTLGEIAQQQLGSVRYVKNILELNPGLIASNLMIGDTLVLPAKSDVAATVAVKEAMVSKAGEFHVVASGDSLTVIANKYYPGKYEYIEKIAAANKQLLKDGKNTVLRIGWKLNLPE